MRPRTLILLILVLIVGAVTVVLFLSRQSGGDETATTTATDGTSVTSATSAEGVAAQAEGEPGVPVPTPTPILRFESVVVAAVNLPVGQRLTAEVLKLESRPTDNVALQGGYTFSEIEAVVGQILRVDVREGQEILNPMLALNSTDLGALGSDLALYVNQGKVAVAFPIDPFSGAAYAMRPGDFVDVMMTLRVVEIDPEFRTALPNQTQRVIQSALLEGQQFLFDSTIQGRLEFIPAINQVAEILPNDADQLLTDVAPGAPIPKRVTQLTIQQAEVLWVGTWQNQDDLRQKLEPTPAPVIGGGIVGGESTDTATPEPTVASDSGLLAEEKEEGAVCLSPVSNQLVPCPIVREKTFPDMIILSLSAQDALALKWAMERGVNIDLALRAPGDNTIFFTTSVSLPQIVSEGGLAVPAESDFDLFPRADEVDIPSLPNVVPTN